MATFLDLGLLNYFAVIFPALIVFVIVYAVFEKFKLLGENKTLHAIIAISMSFLVIISNDVVKVINFISPWFVLVFIFFIFMLMVFKIMGESDASIAAAGKDKAVVWTIIIISLIIIGAGLSSTYGQRLLTEEGSNITISESTISTTTGEFSENVSSIFFHPKIIGLIFIFLVAVFSVSLLTRESI